MIERAEHLARVLALLRDNPVVALLGARQVGKTTLASAIGRRRPGPVHRFDLENPADLARLADPMLALADLRGLVILDEIQRRPELFPALRVLADRRPVRARFLVLGSASPALLRQGSESLAGRIAFHELPGFSLREVPPERFDRLWIRGGFPRSYLARSEAASWQWRQDFVRTFVERDLPQLGLNMAAESARRFWTMLAHHHGQLWNASELGRAFGVADTTVRGYLDKLTDALVVRQLPPWHENLAKRQVKSPKLYVRDSGLLHALLGLPTRADVEHHPKLGASWEGFLVEQLIDRLGARPGEFHFWATHQGAELDLLIVRGSERHGFEFKRTTAPEITPSMRSALSDLRLDSLTVVHAGSASYPMAPRVHAVHAGDLPASLAAIRRR